MPSQQEVGHRVPFEFANKVDVLLCDLQMDGTGDVMAVAWRKTRVSHAYVFIFDLTLLCPRPQADRWVELMLRD
jgi:hypothetical protein